MTIVFFRGRGIVPRIIALATRSSVSHVGIGARFFGLPVVIHATVGGVQVTPRARMPEPTREFLVPIERMGRLSLALRELGTKYDYVGLLGFAFVLLGRWARLKVQNPLASPRAVVCSELVSYVALDDIEAADETTPEDLLEHCQRSYEEVIPCRS